MRLDKFLFGVKVILIASLISAICALSSNSLACCAVVHVNPDSRLNVRSGPGTEHHATAGLSNGAQLHVLQQQAGWALVAWPKHPNHPLGWASIDYLQRKENHQ